MNQYPFGTKVVHYSNCPGAGTECFLRLVKYKSKYPACLEGEFRQKVKDGEEQKKRG
jgi:hypothetical protein